MRSTWSRFQIGSRKRVGEPEVQQVLDGLLAEVVIDPEDRLLGKELVEDARRARAPRRGRGRTASRRRRARHPCSAPAARARGHVLEEAGRNRQIVERTRRPAQRLAQTLRTCSLVEVVALDVAAAAREQRERRLVHLPCASTLARARAMNSSRVQSDRATPITGMSSCPAAARP